MPKVQRKQDSPRQRSVSCRFCRTRKLRCSRQAPCSNCVSRGIQCELDNPIGQSSSIPRDSEPEVVERLNRLEKLLKTQKSEQDGNVSETPNGLSTDSPRPQSQHAHNSASSPQIEGFANDVAWLENIYRDRGLSVR
jgi:Fungal Zn(2)-Cys(6) binuclear cluster domain